MPALRAYIAVASIFAQFTLAAPLLDLANPTETSYKLRLVGDTPVNGRLAKRQDDFE